MNQFTHPVGRRSATLTGYVQQTSSALPNLNVCPAVLICPGGGYVMCSQRESEPVALNFLPEGYNVFVLTYSVAPHRFPTQLREVAAAMELIYANAAAWHCDTERVAIMGFSAGGHLAAHYSTCFDCPQVREIFPDSKNILFRIGGTTLITRLIEGEFLNYRAAIPNDFEHVVDIDSHELISSIERVSLIVSEKLKNPVRFHFDGNYVQLSCVTAIGKSYDECPIDGCIEDLEIGFNNKYMMDALKAAPQDKVTLELSSPITPCIIVPAEGEENFLFMVLPVRLKAES